MSCGWKVAPQRRERCGETSSAWAPPIAFFCSPTWQEKHLSSIKLNFTSTWKLFLALQLTSKMKSVSELFRSVQRRFVKRSNVTASTTYTIQAGDTFSSIAAKLGLTVAAIEAANPGVNPDDLQIGEVIQLAQSASTYTIASGDTFSSIATKFGISVAAIEAANPGVNPNDLQIGQQINIPSATNVPAPAPAPAPQPTPVPPTPAPVPSSGTYVIQPGDTFTSIAARLGTTVAALEAANPTLTPTDLQIGASINVPSNNVPAPVPTPPAPTPPASGATYTIKAGDTFTTMAASFNTTVAAVEAANPGVNPTTLQIGQIINLPPGVTGGQSTGGTPNTGSFINYSGPASSFPDPSQWASYASLWQQNSSLMTYNDNASEITLIGSAITTVSQESGIDARVILCIIMQESGGNVRVGNTNNGVNNTGIMQAFNGVSFNPSDPAGSILQMVRDGTEGTASGPGFKQAFERYGNYYVALRVYNSGSVDLNQLNDPLGATANYVEDVANRLMGHTWPNM
jgi:LysM repeat protein